MLVIKPLWLTPAWFNSYPPELQRWLLTHYTTLPHKLFFKSLCGLVKRLLVCPHTFVQLFSLPVMQALQSYMPLNIASKWWRRHI